MKLERSDVEFPFWRKKVDAALFKDAYTPIPKFLWKIWSIEKLFVLCRNKENPDCKVKITYDEKEFTGRILHSPSKTMYRLFFSKDLSDLLKDVFVMSYMRSIEQDLRKNKPEYAGTDVEDEIPFWEFLDIEFDLENKSFRFKAYYTQKPVYTELFRELVKSHTIRRIGDDLNYKDNFRFTKGDWTSRVKLSSQLDSQNVIYNLVDTERRRIYIGEAESLVKRLKQEREEIRDWDFYRFDALPSGLTKQQRVAIERLIIRTFASFFENFKDIPSMKVSNYILANKKIDS